MSSSFPAYIVKDADGGALVPGINVECFQKFLFCDPDSRNKPEKNHCFNMFGEIGKGWLIRMSGDDEYS